MASPHARRVLKDLRVADTGNNRCFECNGHSPQWVSVSYGIWVCLECSGKHRSLGVHLSFVRSTTMDKWKDSELEKMKAGGNTKAKQFFDEHDFSGNFQQKWNSKAAALYRDKITAESEGRNWIEASSPAQKWTSMGGLSSSNDSRPTNNESKRSSDYNSSSSYSAGNDGYQSYADGGTGQSAGGNRYQGFGNTPDNGSQGGGMAHSESANQIMENAMSGLSMGWSSLSKVGASAAGYAKDISTQAAAKTVDLAGQARNGGMLETMGQSFSTVKEKASGWQGWQNFTSALGNATGASRKETYETMGDVPPSFSTPNMSSGYQNTSDNGGFSNDWSSPPNVDDQDDIFARKPRKSTKSKSKSPQPQEVQKPRKSTTKKSKPKETKEGTLIDFDSFDPIASVMTTKPKEDDGWDLLNN